MDFCSVPRTEMVVSISQVGARKVQMDKACLGYSLLKVHLPNVLLLGDL